MNNVEPSTPCATGYDCLGSTQIVLGDRLLRFATTGFTELLLGVRSY